MARRRRAALILVALAAAVGVTCSTAATVQVHASVSFNKTKDGIYRSLVLTIHRGNEVVTRNLGASYLTRPQVHVRDLDADGEPEVWVDTFTGGAHCCAESRFFRWVPARATYAGLLRNWRDPGYSANNIDGRGDVELMSNDARFAYEFTSFAASFFPLQIWHYERGRLIDVTRLFPGEVDHDSTELWNQYRAVRAHHEDVRGVLAAWQADQYLLGREASGWKKIQAARARGELGPLPGIDIWPQGAKYVTALRAFLVKTGYAA